MTRQKRLGNFQDPFGLLGRMLASGNKAAYAALFREALRIAAKPVDAAIRLLPDKHVDESNRQYPLLFVVGAPRSGTTLIYQALAAYLDVTVPTNFTELFPKSPLAAARALRLVRKNVRPDFRNFYGQTTHFSGPNDAFHIWNRWLGADRYHPNQQLSADEVTDMRQFFFTWTATFGKPFLNKNNRNAFAVERLAKHLPNAKFVVVRRNPQFVAQSLIIARQQIQGTKAEGWGLQSTSMSDPTDGLGYVNDVCQQVASIDEEIQQQVSTVAADRVLEVTYEGFCQNPQAVISRIAGAFEGVELDSKLALQDLPPFQISQKLKISHEEQVRLRQCLSPLNTRHTVAT